ncbi:MAG: hypothetical protein AB1529_03480 [Candidatus Micrarchaeota archaeon]
MDLEAELLKSVQKGELEALVAERIKSFHGFLTREVALRLIAKEKGLLKTEEKSYRLADIPKGEKRVSFIAKVKKVWPVAAYSSGKRSRVVEVEDESGGKPLILWNGDVELAAKLRTRDGISVRGAYEKGGELHLGYSGTLDVTDKAAFTELAELKENESAHVRGYVAAIEGADSFVRLGRTVRGFSFMVADGKTERRCVIFEGLARSERLREGDEVIIEGAAVRNGNVEIDGHTRMLSRRKGDMLLGQVTKLETRNSELVVEVGGKEALFDRQNALRFMGVQAAEDIALSTVVSLKKDELLNSRIAVKIEQKDGQTLVR